MSIYGNAAGSSGLYPDQNICIQLHRSTELS